MAQLFERKWTKKELVEIIGDPQQIGGAQSSVLSDGKAQGVKAVHINTGGGLYFTVLPGRGMDICEASFKGWALHFFSGTGIASPAYYEEPGLGWLRNFFAGLLTTCGLTSAGAPSVDRGQTFGLHGRVSNSGAENISLSQEWEGDDYVITLKGMIREASAMQENLTLTRTIETKLGCKGFRLHDVIENRGFEPQPLMMLYHFNFGFPLLQPGAEVIGPIMKTEPRDEECLTFPKPQAGYEEKVFTHTLAADSDNRTFIALFNHDVGDGNPLGIVIRFNRIELPRLTQWKMPRQGFYVQGLEPGTVTSIGRSPLRERGELPFIDGQKTYPITIDFEVLDTIEKMEKIREESHRLKCGLRL